MVIAVLSLNLFIADSNSLKAKRMILHSLKSRLRNKFNIAISEVDQHDKWQKCGLAIVGVNNNRRYIDGQFSKIINFIESFHQVTIVDYKMEMI